MKLIFNCLIFFNRIECLFIYINIQPADQDPITGVHNRKKNKI